MRSVLFILFLSVYFLATGPTAEGNKRPNVLWLYLEDVSCWFGTYGDTLAHTPNMDQLAAQGIRYNRFYVPAGVCSATRSAVITGMMQTSIAAHNHRSSRPDFRGQSMGNDFDANILPSHITTIPEQFRAADYYTFNEGGNKDDFNFVWDPKKLYNHRNEKWDFKGAVDGNEWSACPKDKPFFGQIQISGGKAKVKLPADEKMDPAKVVVPPYYPDIPEVRAYIAHHYDCIRFTDNEVGKILAALKRDGHLENTYIILFSDHGYGMHRDKQFLYEGGIRMPMFISGPDIAAGQVNDDLVSGIDVGPTSLALAGIALPAHFEGQDILSKSYTPRSYVIGARDRCDWTIEHIRAVVTKKYKYLKNYLTDRPYMQSNYKDGWPVTKAIKTLAEQGKLDSVQMLFFGPNRPVEELYDLENDPHEIHNLAADPAHQAALAQHREILTQWISQTKDAGMTPESDAGLLCVMRRWGKFCINPEYDKVRARYEAEVASGKTKPKAKP